MAEEVRRVQTRHRQILGELNLSVEAMLMPTLADHQNGHSNDINETSNNNSTDELLLGHPDELLSSPVGCDLDSGFSGSSSASYRCVLLFFFFYFSFLQIEIES